MVKCCVGWLSRRKVKDVREGWLDRVARSAQRRIRDMVAQAMAPSRHRRAAQPPPPPPQQQ
ncbi:hypothetical protein RR46_06789 [Papilio xuthus]|uniref:Uncharacterized protein n=1 Tax=Papilio xuthus TaxID=66420 RepID=A0A194PY29_PAPXU|nr:hypothetical protein RR46_06789 [Papilio xuthus]